MAQSTEVMSIRAFALDWLHLVRSKPARPYLLLTLGLDAALVFTFLVAIQSYLPEQYGGGAALAGYSLAAYGLSKLSAQLLGGRLIDHLKPRNGLFCALALIALGQMALLAGAIRPWAVLPAATVYGLGATIAWPAIYVLATSGFHAGERAKLTSAITATTGLSLALGLAAGVVLPERFPYLAGIGLAFSFLMIAVVAVPMLPTTPAPHHRAAGSRPPSLRDAATSILEPHRLGLSAIVLLVSVALGCLLAIFRAYGRDVLGISFREEVLILAPGAVLGGVGIVAGGVLSDRLGRLPVLGAGALAAGISVGLLSAFSEPLALPILLIAMGGLALGVAIPSLSAMSMDMSKTSSSGFHLGWFLTMEGAGYTLGPLLGAEINRLEGPATVLALAGGLLAFVSLLAFTPAIWTSVTASRAALPHEEERSPAESA